MQVESGLQGSRSAVLAGRTGSKLRTGGLRRDKEKVIAKGNLTQVQVRVWLAYFHTN